ncbi:MOSC domain-containing protein [Martelella soudanensis]|uniref:MOSC domain-containing protein n=1 Tax=unclassified Martelella TaxID=2629616 RepID=UPI0015E02B1E|nr:MULTISPECIES: MOSC domain-containing protein [unclassified Martelella]
MKVAELNIYPMKSARGIALDAARCGASGLEGDRIALLVDPAGRFITQRDLPVLARLTVRPGTSGLLLSMEDKGEIETGASPDRRLEVAVWRDSVNAAASTGDADAVLSDWFERPVRLAFFDEASHRIASRDWVGDETPMSFADGFQVLVTTTGSLAALNADLKAHGAEEVGMERFRPNIVIENDEAWAEDGWAGIEIGGIAFDFVKPCTRCIMTTQDQTTGSREGANPLPALGRLRMSADRRVPGPLFGWNAVPRGEGLLRVGDPVTITRSATERWPLKKRA